MKTLQNLLLDELAEMFDSEHRITAALPRFIDAATCSELRQALQNHLKETLGQLSKVEKVFAAFHEKPRTKECPAMAGLLEDGEQAVHSNENSTVINAAIIATVQKVEHFEIAAYGTLHAWAQLLENEDAAEILADILDEEKAADHTLNDLAESKNQEAFEQVEAGGLA